MAVVGSVGSGKSSLLSAILGEMDKTAGRVNVKVYTIFEYLPPYATNKPTLLIERHIFNTVLIFVSVGTFESM